MSVPNVVEKQAQLADELHRQAYGDKTAVETPVEQPKQAEQSESKNETAVEQPVQQDAAYWKNRFDVLEGKYKAEVPRYADELRTLKQQVQQLEQQKTATPEPEFQLPDDLTSKYGEEFVRDIQKMIPQPNTKHLEDKVQQVEQKSYELQQRDFLAELGRVAPKWTTLNEDQGFLNWLAGMDDFSGMPRKVMFDEAAQRLDVARVAAFFNSYGGTDRSWDGKQRQTSNLEVELVPNTNRATQAPPGRKFWTPQEIAQFYDDKRHGKLSDAEFSRIEQDIFAAQREGRIG